MPQDLGLQGAFGLAGAQQALRQRVLDQLAAEKQKQDLAIQQQDLILRQRQVAGQEADRAGALAERTQAARDTAAAKAAPSLAGTNLTGEQFQPFKGTTSEGLFTPQIGLPSRQTQGAMPLPGGGPINLGPEAQATPAPQSLSVPPLITRQAPQRLTGRMIGTGTAEQQKAVSEDAAAAALAAAPDTPAAMKLFLRVRSALPKGETIPADVISGETARHNKEMERIGSVTAGREIAAQAETARHNLETEKLANPFGTQAGAVLRTAGTGAVGPTGDAFLAALDPGVASQVKAYAEGKQPFPTGMSTYRLQPLLQLVTQYDPSFDAGNYNARNKARTDLTSPSGTGGKIINTLNTAIQHSGKLSDLIEALDNTDIPAANVIKNWWNTQTGSTKVTNFQAVLPQLMKEIERLWRGTGGAQDEIEALKASLGQNMGRQQQREALAQFVGLMKGKLQSTEQQRDNVLGPIAGATVPILFDQSKPILERITQRAGGTAVPETSDTSALVELERRRKAMGIK